MGLIRGLHRGLKRTAQEGLEQEGIPPVVTILTYPSDPTDDPTPTFTFSANEPGCTFEYKINAGSYAACTSPLTLGAQADGTYTIYIRATDAVGNVGAAATYSWDLATAYAGTLPATVGMLNGWSLASPWTILYNFDSATVNPTVPPAVATGSVAHGLIKWGSDATATKTAGGQSGYADQSGYTVNTNQDFVIQYASAAWKFSATVPTCYMMTFKMASTPTSVQTILGGSDGIGGGWYLEAHETAGIRAMIGTGAVYVAMSHVGGTSFYDDEYHTVLLVIDDASGKAKLYTEFGNTESTSLTISTADAICTIGPIGTPYHWSAPVTYLTVARGEHPLLYTNAQSLFDEYEDARLNNVNQTAITGLPTSISDLNTVSGITFDYAYNIGSNSPAPMTGSSGSALAADTGVLHSAQNGTTPTSGSAPKVRTSFTSQGSALFDSPYDNFTSTNIPQSNLPFAMMLVWKCDDAASIVSLASRGDQSPERGYTVTVTGTDGFGLRQRVASSSTTYQVNSQGLGQWCVSLISSPGNNGGAGGNQLLQSATKDGAIQSLSTALIPNSSAAANAGYIGASKPTNGYAAPVAGRNTEIALAAWVQSPGTLPDAAALTAAINSFRWRYGI